MIYDAIVVGLGGVGSFALRALAKASKNPKVLGIEQYVTGGHLQGSSHGYTRIYRHAYFEHPSYVPWCSFSTKQFQELQEEQNVPLIKEAGCIVIEPEAEDGGMPPMCKASYDAAKEHGIPVEYLDNETLRARYPQFNSKHKFVGVYEQSGGLVRPELTLTAAINDAKTKGAEIKEETRVLNYEEVEVNGEVVVQVRIQHKDESPIEVTTKSLLIAGGGWVGSLLPGWADHAVPYRQLQGWLDVSTTNDPSQYGNAQFPAWLMVTPDWPIPMYGPPCDTDGDPLHKHWLKVGLHGRRVLIDNPSDNPTIATPAEIQEVQDAAWTIFSTNTCEQSKLVHVAPCIYTITPDWNFMIGTPKGYQKVFGVAGLSGHGFKMTPALGQMMADFALQDGDISHWKADFCSPSRFGV
jgi:sarcosine oxidase